MFTVFLLNTKKLHNHFYSLHKWFFEKREKIPGNTWKNSAKRDWREEKHQSEELRIEILFLLLWSIITWERNYRVLRSSFFVDGCSSLNCFATQYFLERIFNWSLLSESIHNCLLFQTRVILIVLWLPAQQVFYS